MTTKSLLNISEAVLIGIFSVEYLLRLYVADKKIGFVFSFFGLIDLLAILPFYLSVGLDLRSIRVFRLLRLFRLFKLLRYNQAINRFHQALMIN
ncbi:ion transporter [methanotrophic endosymbiont of Bathymodiolus puteoserpentis (Logatchev)]|jgi:voltage-gated potassium channel|uniref:ion transporter n=1 Tax=methanotrophic endosymbiont of Bathymodiolus puteoserpentis (Logatchev) TaxID=343235 RepID=UPI0013C93DD3|nr:Potassium voltage-gated channel subfamily KQT; possible potassium channel, VIC family [methanotrophic endosymbiont of Bathymodiolus puteoserpentis (Logatchev)]